MARTLPARFDSAAAEAALQALEAAHGGRLGVQVLDTGSGHGFGWRPRQRFALCSTFKLPLAAVVLREHAAGRLDGDALLPLDPAHRVAYAPVREAALAAGRTSMSALELAHATQTTSDNWAANLLLAIHQ
jgi:beta-lactamase class A